MAKNIMAIVKIPICKKKKKKNLKPLREKWHNIISQFWFSILFVLNIKSINNPTKGR